MPSRGSPGWFYSARSPSAWASSLESLPASPPSWGADEHVLPAGGSGSTNPVLFTFGIGLMLAWKVAGYYGVDRYLLPALGTPWKRGSLLGGQPPDRPPQESSA